MSDKSTEVLSLQLLDRTIQLKTAKENAEDLQKAASLFNAKLREVRDKKIATGNERIALMAGLNLAYELISTQKQKDLYLESISGRIKELQEKLEDSLAPKNENLF